MQELLSQIRPLESRGTAPTGIDYLYKCTYNALRVGSNKSRRNIEKHGIDFADAALALEDDLAVTIRDPDSGSEERFITLGMDPFGMLLVVAYTWRGERIRIISARRATSRERRSFEEL